MRKDTISCLFSQCQHKKDSKSATPFFPLQATTAAALKNLQGASWDGVMCYIYICSIEMRIKLMLYVFKSDNETCCDYEYNGCPL